MGWKVIIFICFKFYIVILDVIYISDVWVKKVRKLKGILKVNFWLCLKVFGEVNEIQIVEVLKRYSERVFFVREVLFYLFSLIYVMEKIKLEILKVRVRNWIQKFLNFFFGQMIVL